MNFNLLASVATITRLIKKTPGREQFTTIQVAFHYHEREAYEL